MEVSSQQSVQWHHNNERTQHTEICSCAQHVEGLSTLRLFLVTVSTWQGMCPQLHNTKAVFLMFWNTALAPQSLFSLKCSFLAGTNVSTEPIHPPGHNGCYDDNNYLSSRKVFSRLQYWMQANQKLWILESPGKRKLPQRREAATMLLGNITRFATATSSCRNMFSPFVVSKWQVCEL